MRKRELKNIEWSLIVIATILSIIGLVALFSATQEAEHDEFNKQCVWFVVSIIVMIVVMLIDYDIIAKISKYFYRSIYNFINCSFIYYTNKWCKELV